MVPPSSCKVFQPFSFHVDWMLLERTTWHMLTYISADADPWRFGTSCSSVAFVPPAGLCSGSSSTLKGQLKRKQHFPSVIFIFRWVFLKDFHVSILLQSQLHQHNLGNLSEQILKGSASHTWLCCQSCWPASLTAGAYPVRLIMR